MYAAAPLQHNLRAAGPDALAFGLDCGGQDGTWGLPEQFLAVRSPERLASTVGGDLPFPPLVGEVIQISKRPDSLE